MEPQDTITHEQIRDELRLDLPKDAAIWYAGVRRATTEHGVVLRSIRGVGYARLSATETCDDDRRLRKVRKQAGRGLEEFMTVEPQSVSAVAQSQLAAKSMVLAAIVTQTKPATIRAMSPATSPSAAKALLAEYSKASD